MTTSAEDGSLRTFSTSNVPPRQRVAYWKDAVCAAFVDLDVDCDADAPFRSDLSIRRASGIDVIDVGGSPQSVRRDERLIRCDHDASLIVMRQRTGTGTATQDGVDSALSVGGLTLLDCRRPYSLRFVSDFRQTVAKIPARALEERIGVAATRAIGRALDPASALTRLAAQAFDEVADEGRPGPAARLAGVALDLLALAALESPGSAAREPRMDVLRVTWAKATVLERLRDPSLTPARVADAQGVSLRLLQRHFAEQGESLSGYIVEQRLRCCADALDDERRRSSSITEVALSWGFADASRFARAFRRRFGVSPSEHRRNVRDRRP